MFMVDQTPLSCTVLSLKVTAQRNLVIFIHHWSYYVMLYSTHRPNLFATLRREFCRSGEFNGSVRYGVNDTASLPCSGLSKDSTGPTWLPAGRPFGPVRFDQLRRNRIRNCNLHRRASDCRQYIGAVGASHRSGSLSICVTRWDSNISCTGLYGS